MKITATTVHAKEAVRMQVRLSNFFADLSFQDDFNYYSRQTSENRVSGCHRSNGAHCSSYPLQVSLLPREEHPLSFQPAKSQPTEGEKTFWNLGLTIFLTTGTIQKQTVTAVVIVN